MIQLGTIVLAQMIAVSSIGAGLPQLGSDVRVVDLRCEYMTNPLGVDVAQPRLSWKLESQWRGQKQTAYQILVAASEKMLKDDRADLWDSGKVASDQSIHVVYSGQPLASRTRCYWKVRVWDADDKAGSFSEVATWDMGLLTPQDWKARWITRGEGVPPLSSQSGEEKKQGQDALATKDKAPQPAPLFRKSFLLAETPVSARVYICGLGYHELRLNGEKVGDHVLDPAFTRYDKRALYVVHDVTSQLKKGANALGVMLGNGWYNMHTRCVWDFDKAPWRDRPVLRCQLEMTFDDGSTKVVASDATWRVSTGPIVFDSIRNGETYDARLEKPGWDAPDFDDTDWPLAQVDAGPKGELRAQMMPPIKVTQTLKPAKLTEPKPGVFVFDMGQNMAGWARLRVSGPAGTEVVMRYGERLNADGTLDQQEIGQHVKTGEPQTDTYILKGQGAEVWEPRFAYHGFQYVEVTGLPGKPSLDMLRGPRRPHGVRQGRLVRVLQRPVQPDPAQHALVVRQQLRRLSDRLPAPREERLDGRRAPGRRDRAVQLRLGRRLREVDERPRTTSSGTAASCPASCPPAAGATPGATARPGTAPTSSSPGTSISTAATRGSSRTTTTGMKRYVDYLTSKAQNDIVSIGLGDWVPAKTKTPEKVTSTGYYYRDALIVSKAAVAAGQDRGRREVRRPGPEDPRRLQPGVLPKGHGPLRRRHADRHELRPDHGLVPPARAGAGPRQSRGHDREERRFPRRRHPGHQVPDRLPDRRRPGGCRLWHGDQDHLSELGPLDRRGRHHALGAVGRRRLPQPHHVRPHQRLVLPGPGRHHARSGGGRLQALHHQAATAGRCHVGPQAEHESMYGTIRSHWEIQGDKFILKIAVPVNTTATVYVPCDRQKAITEGPDYIHVGDHAKFLRVEGRLRRLRGRVGDLRVHLAIAGERSEMIVTGRNS